jgi:hypothetical protein
MKDFVMDDKTGARVFRNPYHDFDANTWRGVQQGNSLLLHWITTWIDKYEWDTGVYSLYSWMELQYEYSAGMKPRPMEGKVCEYDGAYDSKDGDPTLHPLLIIKVIMDATGGVGKRLVYIYDYGIVAIPIISGGYKVVRMD